MRGRGRLVDCLTGVESETSLARAARELFGEEEDRVGRDLAELATWIHSTPHMQVPRRQTLSSSLAPSSTRYLQYSNVQNS